MPVDLVEFDRMEREWRAALDGEHACSEYEARGTIEEWEEAIVDMRREQLDLQQKGSWVTGAVDLMAVIGQHRQELAHSAAIEWILDPRMPHGLGSGVLAALLSSYYPDETFDRLGETYVEREVIRPDARIDVLVHAPGMTVVIENKVDAAESDGQCDKYYQIYAGDQSARLVLLTPDGRAPQTASGKAAKAFRRWSYDGLRKALAQALSDTEHETPAQGRAAAEQYLKTLENHFRPGRRQPMNDAEPRLQFYLKNLKLIREWNQLEAPARELSAAVLSNALNELPELASDLGATVRFGKHLVDPGWSFAYFYDLSWNTRGSQGPVAQIGVHWTRATILGDPSSGPWVGLRVGVSGESGANLRNRLKAASASVRREKGYDASWAQWAAYRSVPVPEGEWWKDVSSFRGAIADAVRETWSDLRGIIDEALPAWRHVIETGAEEKE